MIVWSCAVLAALPWLVALRARVGELAAVAIVALATPALVASVMLSPRVKGASVTVMVFGALALAAAAGLGLWLNDRRRDRARGGALPLLLLPASAGAIIALATFVVARFDSGAPRVSWTMLGDSASQFVGTHQVLAEGSLRGAPLLSSVPLPPAIIAAVTAPGRNRTDAGGLLLHDLTAYATTWAALIVVMCLLAGIVGYAIVRRFPHLPPAVAYATVTATSLLPLGWFWSAYPVKFGFINAHIALILLLASMVGYLGTLARPGLGIAIQAVATVLLLLTWGPLAVFPVSLALTQAIGARTVLYRAPRGVRIGVVVAAALGCAAVAYKGIGMLDEVRASLSIPGGLADFPKPMLPAVAVVLVVAVLGARRADTRAASGIIALVITSVGGLAAVLVLSGRIGGAWGYYPQKYAWSAAAFLLIITLPQAVCAVAQLRSVKVRRMLYGAVTVTLAVSLGFGSWWAPGRLHLLKGNLSYYLLVEDDLPDEGQSPDAVANAVIARADLPRLTIPWKSSLANDYRAAFWLIQLERERAIPRGDDHVSDLLWTLANFHEAPADLCTLAGLVPQGLTVQTADATLTNQIDALCPAVDLVVDLEPGSH